MSNPPAHPPLRVVILGAGFAGLNVARGLASAHVSVQVIDRKNHHLFQPLLYQVATATLSPSQIAYPIRSVLKSKNTEVIMDDVLGIDRAARRVLTQNGTYPFDFLVVATGSRPSYFGRDEWEGVAPGLKDLQDATLLRERILKAFERAEQETDPAKRAALLHFVLVGGGPTGVEMAGAIAELSHHALAEDFRRVDPRAAEISLIEAGPRLLSAFPESLSRNAERTLRKLGVNVLTSSRVEQIDSSGVVVGAKKIATANIFWTAGVAASPAGKWLGAGCDKMGRVIVTPHLQLPDDPFIFVAGDTAHCADKNGGALPGVAPVAMQQGHYLAAQIRRRLSRPNDAGSPFMYWNKGNLATIGRSRAVAELGSVRLTGLVAWLAWVVVHVYYLIDFRNRLTVLFDWAWSYFSFHRGARLILTSQKE